MMTVQDVMDDLGLTRVPRHRYTRNGTFEYYAYDFTARVGDVKLLNTDAFKREVYEYIRVGPCALFLVKLHSGGVAGFAYDALAYGSYQMQRFYGLEQYQERVAKIAKHAGKEVSYREGTGKMTALMFTATLANTSIKGFRW